MRLLIGGSTFLAKLLRSGAASLCGSVRFQGHQGPLSRCWLIALVGQRSFCVLQRQMLLPKDALTSVSPDLSKCLLRQQVIAVLMKELLTHCGLTDQRPAVPPVEQAQRSRIAALQAQDHPLGSYNIIKTLYRHCPPFLSSETFQHLKERLSQIPIFFALFQDGRRYALRSHKQGRNAY